MTTPEHSDAIWKRAEIESPCIKICVIHPETRLCTGCLRSIDEIGGWSQMTPDARRSVMDDLPNRAPLLKKRRGGRAARLNGGTN
ncbi:DUF1289 domain-containing protein [Pseudooctadecabacter jejudonensis]|uniref:Fe-S protein n=1 Tax=Pseudooctadecabacter jejudonensis TaxID=1391910 RepID=A0A1Y5RHP2_9RHOB|nr:DUF1289 domain-containing protein [Pseudooctadecabacter jejudonensis]SLN17352.1 hypothetical protein PSJ8397_00552 [Pseudooctadecabacter jejudonensis]